jgi:hypothetical protein
MKNFEFYFDPKSPASFSGLSSIIQTHQNLNKNPKKNEFKNWILNQETYTLHKPLIKNFKREKVKVNGIDDLWQVDLVDVSNLSRENKGYKYLLTIIDVFSKRAWVAPLKNKTGESILNAFRKIIKERKPKKIQSDKGSESDKRY